ncbi:MAG: exo-alpha-sialidase [Gemmataceae bacterium]|nr:exo-alpha-sialidase [Gemmataceae bacterium]
MRPTSAALACGLLLLSTIAARADGPGLVLAADAIQPQVAIDTKANIYVTFLHQGNVVVCASTDRGRTFGPPMVAIDAKGTARGGRQRGPRVGVDGKGTVVVTAPLTFDAAETAKKYPVRDLYLVTSSDGGKTWTRPLRVNEVPRQAPEALHWLAVAPDGTAHVAWLDRRDRAEQPGQDLYYAKVVGGQVGKNVPIASAVCECCAPGLAVDARGNPFAAYREGDTRDSREIFGLPPGAPFARAVRLNRANSNETSCPMSAPAAALSADGKTFAAAWMDKRTGEPNVYWTVADGPVFTRDKLLHDREKGKQDHPALAIDANGTVWAVWEDARTGRQRIRLRTSAVSSSDREVSDAADGEAGYPSIAANAGLTAVVYEARQGGRDRVVFRLVGSR